MLAPDTSYEQWPLGRVLEVYPEAEGHVGAVKLQTGRNVLVRSVTRTCPYSDH